FASDLGNPRMLTVGPDGVVYVTRPKQGDVQALQDADGDGVAESRKAILTDLKEVHGITLHDGNLYVAAPKKLWRAKLQNGHEAGEPELLISDLPDGGQHPNRTLAFGPDGMLYISVGSSCN